MLSIMPPNGLPYGQGAASKIAEIIRTVADMKGGKAKRGAGAAAQPSLAGRVANEASPAAAKPAAAAQDRVELSAAAQALTPGSYGERLRAGTDGMFEMIAMRQNSVYLTIGVRDSMRDTVKLYEETGEIYSRHGNWRPSKEHLSLHGGAEAFIEKMRGDIVGLTEVVIPGAQAVVDEMRASRLERLREYGLAPPALDKTA